MAWTAPPPVPAGQPPIGRASAADHWSANPAADSIRVVYQADQAPPEATPSVSDRDLWVPPGAAAVTIAGYPVPGGMVYIGSDLPAAYAPGVEPSLIDPAAPVRPVRAERALPPDGDQPTYHRLSPGARAAYLMWLAGGRRGSAPIAHPLLFLFGLERRVLIDLAGTLSPTDEYGFIAAELGALRERYGTHQHFRAQTQRLEDVVHALARLTDPAPEPPRPPQRAGRELPLALRVDLGRFIGAGVPLSPVWAYAWLVHAVERPFGGVGDTDDVRQAFAERYAATFPGGGLQIRPPAEEITLSYPPASPGFAGRTVRVHTRLPDVAGMTAPVEQFLSIAKAAVTDVTVRLRRRSRSHLANTPPPARPPVPPQRGTPAGAPPIPPRSRRTATPEAAAPWPSTPWGADVPDDSGGYVTAAPPGRDGAVGSSEPQPNGAGLDAGGPERRVPRQGGQFGPDAQPATAAEPSTPPATHPPVEPGRPTEPVTAQQPAAPPRRGPSIHFAEAPPDLAAAPPTAPPTAPPASLVPADRAPSVTEPAATERPVVPPESPVPGEPRTDALHAFARPYAESPAPPRNSGPQSGAEPTGPIGQDSPDGATATGAAGGGRAGGRRRRGSDSAAAVTAAGALLLLSSVVGIRDNDVLALRRQFVDALDLTLLERHRLDDLLYELTQRRPEPQAVRHRFAALNSTEQAAAADLLVAVAGAGGGLEPAHVVLLAEVFALLGLGEPELNRRLHEMEVASVTFDEATGPLPLGTDVIALDMAHTARIVAESADLADAMIAAILGSPAGGPTWTARPRR